MLYLLPHHLTNTRDVKHVLPDILIGNTCVKIIGEDAFSRKREKRIFCLESTIASQDLAIGLLHMYGHVCVYTHILTLNTKFVNILKTKVSMREDRIKFLSINCRQIHYILSFC